MKNLTVWSISVVLAMIIVGVLQYTKNKKTSGLEEFDYSESLEMHSPSEPYDMEIKWLSDPILNCSAYTFQEWKIEYCTNIKKTCKEFKGVMDLKEIIPCVDEVRELLISKYPDAISKLKN